MPMPYSSSADVTDDHAGRDLDIAAGKAARAGAGAVADLRALAVDVNLVAAAAAGRAVGKATVRVGARADRIGVDDRCRVGAGPRWAIVVTAAEREDKHPCPHRSIMR